MDAGATADNLLVNGGFSIGCANWQTTNMAALYADTVTFRSGGKACRVCATLSGSFAIMQQASVDVAANKTLVLDAYVHSVPSGHPPHVTATITTYDAKMKESGIATTSGPVVDGIWSEFSGELHTMSASSVVMVEVFTDSTSYIGDCFVIDDVLLTAR